MAAVTDQRLQCLPFSYGPGGGPRFELLKGLGSNAAGRHVDNAVKRDFGRRVMHEAQEGEDVFDFTALIEAGCANQPVAQVAADAGLLKSTTLGVGAIDDGGGARSHRTLGGKAGGLIEHVFCFFGLVVGFVDSDLEAAALVGAEVFGRAVGVLGDDGVGDIEDVLRAAVVLFEEDDFGSRVVAAEAEDVAIVGASEAVDGLVLVADDKEVASAVGRAYEV